MSESILLKIVKLTAVVVMLFSATIALAETTYEPPECNPFYCAEHPDDPQCEHLPLYCEGKVSGGGSDFPVGRLEVIYPTGEVSTQGSFEIIARFTAKDVDWSPEFYSENIPQCDTFETSAQIFPVFKLIKRTEGNATIPSSNQGERNSYTVTTEPYPGDSPTASQCQTRFAEIADELDISTTNEPSLPSGFAAGTKVAEGVYEKRYTINAPNTLGDYDYEVIVRPYVNANKTYIYPLGYAFPWGNPTCDARCRTTIANKQVSTRVDVNSNRYLTTLSETVTVTIDNGNTTVDLKAEPIPGFGQSSDGPISVRYGNSLLVSWDNEFSGNGTPYCFLNTGNGWTRFNGREQGSNQNDAETGSVVVQARESFAYQMRCNNGNGANSSDIVDVYIYIPDGHIDMKLRTSTNPGTEVLTVNNGAKVFIDWETRDVNGCQASWSNSQIGPDDDGWPDDLPPAGSYDGTTSIFPINHSRHLRIWCYDILGNIVEDTATINVRDNATIVTKAPAVSRIIDFNIQTCDPTLTNCQDNEVETVTIRNIDTSEQYTPFNSGATIDLQTLGVADNHTLEFRASTPQKGSTSTFNDLCLPLGLSGDSECSGGTYTIEIKTICLFDPASDDDCPELSETSFNDDLPWYKSLYVSAKSWLLGDDALAIGEAPEYPTVESTYVVSTAQECIIDTMQLQTAGGGGIDGGSIGQNSLGQKILSMFNPLNWIDNALAQFGDGDESPNPTYDPGQSLNLVYRATGAVGNLTGGGVPGWPNSLPPDCGSARDGSTYPCSRSVIAPNSAGTYTYTLRCTGSLGNQNTRQVRFNVAETAPAGTFELSASPDQIVVETVTGEANQVVTLTVRSVDGFSGVINFTADAKDLNDKLGIRFNPSSINLPANATRTAQMRVTLDERAARGQYPIEITATADSSSQTDSVELELLNLVDGSVNEI